MSEEYENQLPENSESAATPAQQCPLEPSTSLEALRFTGLRTLEEVEKHLSASNCHHPPLKDLILHGPLDGTTPLLLACYFGDLECVKHIVENWRVDLQTPGVYYSTPLCSSDKIKVATPLFVAARNLHLEIVRYLIGKGADANGKGTRLKGVGGLTPLQGVLSNPKSSESRAKVQAIAFLLLESGADPNATGGRPIWMEPSCGTAITTALVHHGLKVNQYNHFGFTILHDRVQARSFENPRKCYRAMALIKLLVNNGANLMARDKQGFTPVLQASTSGSWAVLDYMLEKNEIVRKEKIDALEMAAATILIRFSNGWESVPEQAFEYLREALLLRQMKTEPFPMAPLKLKRGRIIGWTTSAQLDQVIEEPAEYHLQSYLIQLRILSDSDRSHEASVTLFRFFLECIDHLKEQNRLDDYVDVLWVTIEKIHLSLSDTHHEYGLWRMADYVVPNLIWVLSQLGNDDPLHNADTFRSILKMVLVTDRIHSGFFSDGYYSNPWLPRHMDILLQLVTFLAGLPEEILNDETQEISIKNLLSQLVIQKSRNKRGQFLLHRACVAENLDLTTIQLLLQVNADPNAVDKDGNGPLHVLASLRYGNGQDFLIHRAADAAYLLLENGAHLDRVNQDRKTAAQVWKETNDSQDLPLWLREPGTVPRLKCLSARIIRSNNVPYTTETLIEVLHPFVKMH